MAGKTKKAVKKKRKQAISKEAYILTVCGAIMALVFLPSTVLLFFGMMPTIILALFNISRTQTKTLTVGALNLAGCSPFLLSLWAEEHSMDAALMTVTNPKSIVVMWSAAMFGYLIDWALSGIVSSIMVGRAEGRLKDIARRKKLLVERWGQEVTGDIPLDPYGYPVEGAMKDESDTGEEK